MSNIHSFSSALISQEDFLLLLELLGFSASVVFIWVMGESEILWELREVELLLG